MDRIDEAVLVGLRAWHQDATLELADFDGDGIDHRKLMQLAILAGMKVLLGEPVAHVMRARDTGAIVGLVPNKIASKPATMDGFYQRFDEVPVYAPSLGEGDGR